MISLFEVNETNKMIDQENLDVRTITMGISLLDCITDDVQRTGDPAILGHRKNYERKTMTLPLSAAAVCAFAGAARADVDRTLRSYDYSQINLCEFFLAEVAAERMFVR